MGTVEICDYDTRWPEAFRDVAGHLRTAVGDMASRIDHIGSTSVPGLASKDVIDVQVTVEQEAAMDGVESALAEAGWIRAAGIGTDHDVPGLPRDERTRQKLLFGEPAGVRRAHVHVRMRGYPNQRYPLLFRDYLRLHLHSARAYEGLKRELALLLPHDSGRYADVKDPVCDLIYFAAEDWALAVGWTAGPSDA